MAQMMRRFASRPVRSSRGGNLARHAGAGRQIVRADDAGANRTVPVRKGSATNQLIPGLAHGGVPGVVLGERSVT
jgi:hypothetical protein